jgi:hypothetical protein
LSNPGATPKRRIPGVGWERRGDPQDQSLSAWLRRLKGLVGRPMRLEAVDGHVRLVVVERRRGTRNPHAASLQEGLSELGTRLLAQDPEEAAHTMRHLVFVYDELARKGWAGVEKQSSRVLGKALMQAKMLFDAEPSPVLGPVLDRLRASAAAARAREERSAAVRAAQPDEAIQVREVSYEEFRETEMGWVGTLPCGLEPDASSK